VRPGLARCLVLALLCGLDCAPRAPSATPRTDQGEFGKLDTQLDGRRWLDSASGNARAAGAEASEVIAVDAGAPGDRVGAMLGVPADECVLLMARAAESVQDIDLYAYAEDGAILGSDERPDRTPTLLICPPHPRRMYVVARVAAGHGVVAVGAQRVAVNDAKRVARQVGIGDRSPTSAGRFAAWAGLDEKVAQRRRELGSSWQELRRVALPVDPRVPTRVSATVEADHCLDVLVVPTDAVAHLDVSVLDADSRVLGRAGAHGRDRALVLCSAAPATVAVEVRPHAGEGLVAVVLSQSAEGALRDLDMPTLVYDMAPTLELRAARARHAERLARSGYHKPQVVGRGSLAVGKRTSVPLELRSGCARLDLVAGRPVRGVQMWLWTEAGTLLAHEQGTGSATVFACGPDGKLRLDVEALALPGPYVVEHRAEPGTPAVLQAHPLAASRLLGRMTSRGVIRRAGQVGAAKLLPLSSTQLRTEQMLVPIGRCVDFTLALGPHAVGAEIRLVNAADGQQLELGRGAYSAAARACAFDQPRTLQVRAELRCLVGETKGLLGTRMLAPKR
jgi:hypothetical protein